MKDEKDFPGGPVVKSPHFHFRGCRFNPFSQTKSPHAMPRNAAKKVKFFKFKKKSEGWGMDKKSLVHINSNSQRLLVSDSKLRIGVRYPSKCSIYFSKLLFPIYMDRDDDS